MFRTNGSRKWQQEQNPDGAITDLHSTDSSSQFHAPMAEGIDRMTPTRHSKDSVFDHVDVAFQQDGILLGRRTSYGDWAA